MKSKTCTTLFITWMKSYSTKSFRNVVFRYSISPPNIDYPPPKILVHVYINIVIEKAC